ncbi:hypothetical protein D3C76_1662690 [compost metagenome]
MLAVPLVQIGFGMTDDHPQDVRLVGQIPCACAIADAVHDHGRQRCKEAGGCSSNNTGACGSGQLHPQAAFGNGNAAHHLQGGRRRNGIQAMVDADGA